MQQLSISLLSAWSITVLSLLTLRLTKWSKSFMRTCLMMSKSVVNKLGKVPSKYPNVLPYRLTSSLSYFGKFFQNSNWEFSKKKLNVTTLGILVSRFPKHFLWKVTALVRWFLALWSNRTSRFRNLRKINWRISWYNKREKWLVFLPIEKTNGC